MDTHTRVCMQNVQSMFHRNRLGTGRAELKQHKRTGELEEKASLKAVQGRGFRGAEALAQPCWGALLPADGNSPLNRQLLEILAVMCLLRGGIRSWISRDKISYLNVCFLTGNSDELSGFFRKVCSSSAAGGISITDLMCSLVRRKFRGCFWQSLLLLKAKGMFWWMPVPQEASGSSQGPLSAPGQLSVRQHIPTCSPAPAVPIPQGSSEAASCSAQRA